MGGADASSDFWAPRPSYSKPALSARRASTTLLSGPTYSMFAERNLAQAPHVAPATPVSPVCALGGSLASLAMRLLCLFIPATPPVEPQRSADSTPPLCGGVPACSTLGPAHCPTSSPSPTRRACPASTEPAPAPEIVTADPIPPDDDAPAPHGSPAPTPIALPSPPPSASPSPVRPCSAPPSPLPSPPCPRRLCAPPSASPSPSPARPSSAPPSPPSSPPSHRRLCAIQSCNRPAYVDERPDALAVCCSRRHQLLHTALQQTPVCALAEYTRPIHIDEQATIVHEYCGITHARLAATRRSHGSRRTAPLLSRAQRYAPTPDATMNQSKAACYACSVAALTPTPTPPRRHRRSQRLLYRTHRRRRSDALSPHATVSLTPTIARATWLPTAAPSISNFISLCSIPRVLHRTRPSQQRRLPPASQPLCQLFSYAPYRRAKILPSSTLALATWRSAAATATKYCTPPSRIHRCAALPTPPCQCSSSLLPASSTIIVATITITRCSPGTAAKSASHRTNPSPPLAPMRASTPDATVSPSTSAFSAAARTPTPTRGPPVALPRRPLLHRLSNPHAHRQQAAWTHAPPTPGQLQPPSVSSRTSGTCPTLPGTSCNTPCTEMPPPCPRSLPATHHALRLTGGPRRS